MVWSLSDECTTLSRICKDCSVTTWKCTYYKLEIACNEPLPKCKSMCFKKSFRGRDPLWMNFRGQPLNLPIWGGCLIKEGLNVHVKGKSIMPSLDSVHLSAVLAKTQTNLDWSLTLYLRMKLKKPVLGMFTVNWSTVGEGPLVPSARTTPTTRTLWPAVLMIVVWLILFVGGCRGTKIIQKGKNIKNCCCHKSGAAGL